ncbi:hypothetical protein C0991_005914 [Blastosporella zonata]|nr:hypothetical protein C0991_005914 [Blastosporella zonata]
MKISLSNIVLSMIATAAVSSALSLTGRADNGTVPFTDPSLTRINTTRAAIPTSPISQAIISGDHLYVSGYLPLAPYTGAIVGPGDVVAQTLAVLSNIQEVVQYAGTSLNKVVKVTNISDYETVNAAYASFFGTHRPARTAIAAADIPLGVLVEIDAIVSYQVLDGK